MSTPHRPSHRRGRNAAALLAACAVSIAGCSLDPEPFDLEFLSAPVEVRSRSELPACGIELVGRGGTFNVEARQCFWDAYLRGAPAEFITTRPSGGGAPLVAIFRSLGPGSVEYFVDESAIYGEPFWVLRSCTGLTPTRDPQVAVDWIPGKPGVDCEDRRLGG